MDNYNNFNSYDNKRERLIKIIFVLFCSTILLFVIGLQIFNFLTTGNLVISSDQDVQITITKYKDTNINNPFSKTLQGSSKIALKDGIYIVNAQTKGYGESRYVTIKGHATSVINFNKKALIGSEPVTLDNAKSIFSSLSLLEYFNNDTGQIYSIDSSGTKKTIAENLSFQKVRWDKNGNIVASTKVNDLYFIKENGIFLLTQPSQEISSNLSDFDISPNGSIYLSYGKNIYTGDSGGNWKKISSTKGTFSLYASDNCVAALGIYIGKIPKDLNTNSQSIVCKNGREIDFNSVVRGAAWSPDGSKLAIQGVDTTIYDSETGKVLQTIPSKDPINSFTWLSNTVLTFSTQSLLWTFDTSTNIAVTIDNLGVAGNYTGIFSDSSNNYLYTVVSNNQGASPYTIERYPLKGQETSSVANQLAVFLPNSVNGCSLSFINFTKITIFSTPTESSSTDCTLVAKNYLQGYGVNTDSLLFKPAI